MRKISFGKILVCACTFGTFLIIPYILNAFVVALNREFNIVVPLYFNLDNWYDLMAIAFPSALTYFVLSQSEQQQKENVNLQARMEQLNKKMLDIELKSKIGYFLPNVDTKRRDGVWLPYKHLLKDGIDLVHAGDDIVFVIEASYMFHGQRRSVIKNKALCFIDKPSFNCYHFALDLTEEELRMFQIDIDIILVLKNSKGYQYRQIINLGFDNNNGEAIINRFNMIIQEVSSDAD